MITIQFYLFGKCALRTVEVVEAPVIGDHVVLDEGIYVVRGREWNLTNGLPNGRSLTVVVEDPKIL